MRELYALRPDRMKVVPGPDGWPQAFDYTVDGRERALRPGGATQPPILHLTLFNPLDDYYGLSAAGGGGLRGRHRTTPRRAGTRRCSTTRRGPPARWSMAGPRAARSSDEQFERLKRELEREYQGAANAGRPLVLEGGLDWKAMSLTPKDMDFMEAKHAAAREIALAFGVPPMLLAMALGHADDKAAINSWRSPRAPLEDWASFDGFDS